MPGRSARALLLTAILTLATAVPQGGADPSPPISQSAFTETVVVPWTNGTFYVGLGGIGVASPADGVPELNMREWALEAVGCERRLFLDLLFSPTNLTGQDDPLVEMDYMFLVTLRMGGERADLPIEHPVENRFLLELPSEGAFGFALRLQQGADVDWSVRLVARTSLNGDGCGPDPLVVVQVTEMEANPAGTDTGYEWVELHNLGTTAVDLSGWTIATTHGVTVNVTLPEGTTIAGGGFVVVQHTTQWLDNKDEQVVLLDAGNVEIDRTDVLTDGVDDSRSWQRDGAAWVFATATPGS